MTFHEFGNRDKPHIMLIHGGGNGWWNYLRQAQMLSEQYHVILPNLDGHGEDSDIPYVSTEDTAGKLLSYIDTNCGGHLFALCGVSLGGQIVIELLSERADLAKKAIIDGSLCYPNSGMARFCIVTVRLCAKLLFSEKACKKQLAMMPKLLPEKMLYPEEIQRFYLRDMPRTPIKTLITIYRTYMAEYRLKDSIRNTTAKIMYWYGEKEMKCVKRSAKLLQSKVADCDIYEAKGYNHGYLAIYLPNEWMEKATVFLQK